MTENTITPDYSFQSKEMKQAVSFLEEINMIANVGGWEMDFSRNDLYWTNGTKRIQDLHADYKPDFDSALQFYKEGENRDRLKMLVRRAIKEGLPFDQEFQLITAKNREIWVRSIGIPEIVNGRCIRLYGSVQDITAQKVLQFRNEELKNLYDVVVDLSGKIIQSSVENIEEAINTTIQVLGELNHVDRVSIFQVGENIDELVLTFEWHCSNFHIPDTAVPRILLSDVPACRARFRENHYIYIHDTQNIPDEFSLEQDIIRMRGVQSLVAVPMYFGREMIGCIIFDSISQKKVWEEKFISLVKIIADICAGGIGRRRTENFLIEARRNAEFANLAKNEFILTAGNELKTPLHAILGFAQVLLNSDLDESHRQQVKIIENNGRNLASMIDDLMVLSRIEANSQVSNLSPTLIRDIVEEIKQLFISEIEKKQLSFNTIMLREEKIFLIDKLRLKQVLMNFISNAVKFTNRGYITVKVQAQQSKVDTTRYDLKISVTDTGIGIADSNRKLIDEFFSNKRGSLSIAGGGLGLGLHIAKRLSEIMQGSIEMESELGKGSTFSLMLKNVSKADSLDRVIGKKATSEQVIFRNQTVLVVEDVKIHFDVLKELLLQHNLNLVHAPGGERGIELANSQAPEMILMDIRMEPGISGFKATEILRENPVTKKIPIIVFSSNIEDERLKMHKHLFDDSLKKAPTDYADLITVLKKFLDHDVVERVNIENISREKFSGGDDQNFISEIVESQKDRIKKISEIIDVSDIENLITDLESYRQQGHSVRLNNYVNALKSAFEAFDFDVITDLLKTFEQKLSG